MDRQREKTKLVRLERHRTLSYHSPGIDKLNILGFYSMDTNFEFMDNLSQLRYLKIPAGQNVNFDLKITAERTVPRRFTTNQVKLDSLLKWIIAHLKDCNETPTPRRIREIVSYRGLLTKVMTTPYERMEGWIVCATKFQGKIYLCKYDTPEKVRAEEKRNERERNMCNWGYVFEQYMVSDHPKHSPDISLPTDQNEEFSSVFRTRLGHHNLLYGAEMDGLEIDEKHVKEPITDAVKLKDLLEKGLAKFVELKSSADASVSQREWSKICRFKSLRWWVQCYLGGIPELICGYRGDDGVIRSLKTFTIKSLPQLAQGNWHPDVCLDYCSRFLDLVTNHVTNGPDEVLWSFTWNPKNPNHIEIGHFDNDSEYSFLHKWFTDEFKKNAKRKSDSSPSRLRESSESKAKMKIG